MVIPRYMMVFIPILTVWWAHRRAARKEYRFLAGSILCVCLALLVYSRFESMLFTWYAGPLAATGIMTAQIPLSIFVAAAIAAIPKERKLFRNVVAIFVGEVLLMNTWIS